VAGNSYEGFLMRRHDELPRGSAEWSGPGERLSVYGSVV
jgi:hypothetical protein